MSDTKLLVTKEKLDKLANSISLKSGVSTPMTIAQMKAAVDGITEGTIIQDEDGYLVISESGSGDNQYSLQQKTVNPTMAQQTVVPDSGYYGLSKVIVNSTGYENRDDLTVPKDVDFVDYDGRLVYSYTAAEFLELTALPANPTNDGLVAQGWNWTLADAQDYVEDYGALVIGQNYTTDDGKTRLYMTISDIVVDHGISVPVYVNIPAYSGGTYIVDWGDGTISDTISTGNGPSHVYEQSGDYVIKITVVTGNVKLGYFGANNTIIGQSEIVKNCLTKVEIGNNIIGLGRNTFYHCINLKSVSIPTACIVNDTGNDIAMFASPLLTGVVFPSGTLGQNTNIIGFNSEQNLRMKYIAIPKSMNGFKINSSQMRSLRKLTFYTYTSSTTLELYLYDCVSLTHFIVPGTYTTIGTDRCRASLIHKLIIPSTVTSISATAFVYNNYCTEIHLLPESPPTLSNVNAFGLSNGVTIDRVFYVPYSADHSILNAYKTATNWSTYASLMQEEPQ